MFENLNVTETVGGCVKEFLGDKHHDCQNIWKFILKKSVREIIEKEIVEFCRRN